MNEHHRRMIRYSLKHLKFLEQQIVDLDEEIRKKIQEAGYQPSCELLQTVPGVQETTAAVLLAEMGPDMSTPRSGQEPTDEGYETNPGSG
jgi:transposase